MTRADTDQSAVLECSDDKNLGKMERKQAQIDHAKDKSDFASTLFNPCPFPCSRTMLTLSCAP